MKYIPIIIIILILTFNQLGCKGKNVDHQNNIAEKISDFMKPYVESQNFSGGILVVQDEKVLFEDYYGMANYELNVLVSPETKFNIASISKSFTAASILLLKERGFLNVTDPVSRFIPDYPNGDIITIHHLLVHSAGLPRIIFFPDFPKLKKHYHNTEKMVDLFKDKPLIHRPGEKSSYSNSHYILLAHLVEKISGLTFNEFLTKNIFQPLEMSNTVLNTGNNDLISNHADGYEVKGFFELENTEYANPSLTIGASSIYSTVIDLNKWMKGLISKKVLNSDSQDQMFKPHVDNWGYGWILSKKLGHNVYTLGGWSNHGYISGLTHFPDENLTVVILSNIEIITIKEAIESGIVAIIFGEEYKQFKYDIKPVDPKLAKQISGTYQFGKDFYNPNGLMTINAKDGHLYEYQERSARYVGMIQINNLEFIHRSSWGKVLFRMNEKGKITGLQIYGCYEAKKIK
jgi:CubicO group peptidase (beta-lactamase class C family)